MVPEAEEAFSRTKQELVNASLLSHPSSQTKARLLTDASDMGMGATLEQKLCNIWNPLAFFSRKFSPTQRKYSAYNRELTQRSEKASLRQQTQLSFISQFSTKIEYLPGKDNVVADSLSRMEFYSRHVPIFSCA